MFGSFRKHQKWIWAIIIIGLIPGLGVFLWVGNPRSSRAGRGDAGGFQLYGKPVTIMGRPVTQEEVFRARNELMLAYFIRSGGRQWPQENERFLQEAVFRVFMIKKLKELEIEVSQEAVARLARARLGNFPYRKFEQQILQPKGLTGADFERYARHEAAIQQLVAVATLDAKLITPLEAEQYYRRRDQEVATELAVFWSTNYLDKFQVTEEKVGQYYSNQLARYRIPDRTVVSYVGFPATNFLAEADQKLSTITNLEAQIEDMYYQQGTNSFLDTNGVVLSAEAAKAKIREETRMQLALRSAHQKANEFGTQLSEESDPNQAGNLERLAAAYGYTVQVTPPFDRYEGLDEERFPPGIKDVALKLSKERPIAFDPIGGPNAFYVIAFKETIPSNIPLLQEIKDKVTTDFQDFEAVTLARSDGTNFYTILTNGLAQGKTFSELTAQEKVKVETPAPFSLATTNLVGLDPRLDLMGLQRLVSGMDECEASRFQRTPDGGFILYLRDRLPIDEAKMRRELPELVGRLRQYRQAENFSQWFNKQAEQARLVIPRPEPTESTSSAAPAARPM